MTINWIKYTERLPGRGEKVLVKVRFEEYTDTFIARYIPGEYGEFLTNSLDPIDGIDEYDEDPIGITHWAELDGSGLNDN